MFLKFGTLYSLLGARYCVGTDEGIYCLDGVGYCVAEVCLEFAGRYWLSNRPAKTVAKIARQTSV